MRQEHQAAATLAGPDLDVRHEPARRVRIAVSVSFGLATVAILVVWVRSYSNCDAVYGPLFDTHTFNLSACWARVRFATFDRQYENQFTGERLEGWGTYNRRIKQPPSLMMANTPLTQFGLGFAGTRDRYGMVAVIPIYALAATASALACIPWLITCGLGFSLRTLLIITTLVALVLGFAVWMIR